MRAGMLRHRVTIQRQEIVFGKFGAPLHDKVWENVATVWASLEAMSGREFFASQQAQSGRDGGHARHPQREGVQHRCPVAGQPGPRTGVDVPGGKL